MRELQLTGLLLYLGIEAKRDWKEKEISLTGSAAAALAGLLIALFVPVSEAGLGLWNIWLCLGELLGTAEEILPGLLPGVMLLILGWATGQAVGYGDGIAVMVCGMYLRLWDTLFLAAVGLLLMFPFSVILLLSKKGNCRTELAFLPFLLVSYVLWLCCGSVT